MASSLRSRLLLSYALLIVALVVLVSLVTLVTQLRNPLVYEQSAVQLRAAQRLARAGEALPGSASAARQAALVGRIDQQLGVRATLLGNDGNVLADSRSSSAAVLRPLNARLDTLEQTGEIGLVRDHSGALWLALVQRVDAQTRLILAVPRPRLAAVQFFTSDFLRPITVSSLVGLALAVLIALLMARWIAKPIERINAATDRVAAGDFEEVPLEGPNEEKRLAASFNRMAERVRDAQQSQRDLVANVSHELKTPLTSIEGFSQAMLEGVIEAPEDMRHAAQVIHGEAERMQHLVQELLALAQLRAGTVPLRQAPVDLAALMRTVAERFGPQAEKAGLRLVTNLPELPAVTGDGERLAEVLANLVDNAIKYSPAGGEVVLSGQVVEGNVELRVADNGTGIPAQEKERIFERFYRADASHPGSGLGLTISREIVLAHGGSLRVVDNVPRGSIFVVTVPIGPRA
jgi:signal transduction histidine kinase